jgi:membrane protein involved in D-alanine export
LNGLIIYIVSKIKLKNNLLNIFISVNVIAFVLIKYRIDFLPDFFNKLNFVGISFVTFKMISLIFDIRNETVKSINPITYYNYLSFFPTYLSGPLYKYNDFESAVTSDSILDEQGTFDAVYRFVYGTFKKVVLADLLYNFSLNYFSLESAMGLSVSKAYISLWIYAIVLYWDFSGYSDMAVSLSALMGIKVPINFNRPYLAINIQDFWNRWHMSFMNWLRDYIYYPFQMFLIKNLKMKSMNIAIIISTMLIFIITGLWHGNQQHFLFYGMYHAICFAIFLLWKNNFIKKFSKETRIKYFESSVFNWFARILTLNYFVFGLAFFINKYQVFFK